MRTSLAFIASILAAHAQLPAFEVAAIKASPPRAPNAPRGTVGCFGGPGSSDPSRYRCSRASLSLLALEAYGLEPYQLKAFSSDETMFDIVATVPSGTTAPQVKLMLRNLLTERFKLAFHFEKTETPGYELVIAKSGVKMKETDPTTPDLAPTVQVHDADGFAYFPPQRKSMAVSWSNDLTRYVGHAVSLARVARLLSGIAGRPVIDATGLSGDYDFALTYTAKPDGDGLNVFAAAERQLGLKLESKKVRVDLFVIDHVEKSPVEN